MGMALALGGVTQLSSLHPRGECRGVVRGCPAVLCQLLGLPEELRSSTSSFLGSLLQLSGALMPCLAPCQHPVCAQVLGPLAADLPCHAQGNPPASFHPWFLCPCPQAPRSLPCQTPFPGEGSGVGAACSPQAWALPKPCQASLLLVGLGPCIPVPRCHTHRPGLGHCCAGGGETPQSASAPGTPQYAPLMVVCMG